MDTEINMSHQVTVGSVTFEQVEVDLDYADIQENLDFSEYVQVDDLQHQIEYHMPDMEDECTIHARSLLQSFINAEIPCDLGRLFIESVQKAMMWQGDRFVEPAFTNSEARTIQFSNLKATVRTVLADMLLGTPNVNGETTHEIGNH
jgi:hypothetical protein